MKINIVEFMLVDLKIVNNPLRIQQQLSESFLQKNCKFCKIIQIFLSIQNQKISLKSSFLIF
jgi:hypothetical protein